VELKIAGRGAAVAEAAEDCWLGAALADKELWYALPAAALATAASSRTTVVLLLLLLLRA